jgi:antitoxin (DNA-binding transcriptional repressor) of toxin-antitoxin stability system
MKEITISVTEFKAKCLRLLDDVEKNGDQIVITKRGRPLARVERMVAEKPRLKGTWKDTARILGDIVYFTDDPWEVDSERFLI